MPESLDRSAAQRFRAEVATGRHTGPTAGHCMGFAQANLVVLPKNLAYDFLVFATRNPKPCPIIEVLEPGNPEPALSAPGADIRTDIPKLPGLPARRAGGRSPPASPTCGRTTSCRS